MATQSIVREATFKVSIESCGGNNNGKVIQKPKDTSVVLRSCGDVCLQGPPNGKKKIEHKYDLTVIDSESCIVLVDAMHFKINHTIGK